MKINRQKIVVGIKLILYRITYEIIFDLVIEDYYNSIMQISAYGHLRYFVSWILFLLIIIPSSQYLFKNFSVSKGILIFLLLIYYIPGTVYFAYRDIPYEYYFYFVAHYFFLMLFFKNGINLKTVYFSKEASIKVLKVITIFVIVGSFLISAIFNGFRISLSLDDVYSLRIAQREMNVPLIVGYFQPFAATFLPFAITYYLDKKKYFVFLLSILAQVLLFSFGGMKTTLFLIPVVLFCYYMMKKYKNINLEWLINLFIFINIVSLFCFILLKEIDLVALFQVRTMLTPNRISVLYFDFFSDNTPDYFRQSFLRYFGVNSPYNVPISKLIAQVYEGTSSSLNNGLLGDVFMNFGKFGIIVQPFLWAVMLRTMDIVSKRINPWVAISLSVAYGMIIPNMSFIGSMVTSGFILMCIVIYTMPRDY